MIDTCSLLNVQPLKKKRTLRDKICGSVNCIHSINSRRRAWYYFHIVNVKIVWTEGICNWCSNVGGLYIHPVYHLDKPNIRGVCKTPCIDHLKSKTWCDQLNALNVFYSIEERRLCALTYKIQVHLFNTDGCLQYFFSAARRRYNNSWQVKR